MTNNQTEKYKEYIELFVYFILLYIAISLIILFLAGSFDSVITRHMSWLFTSCEPTTLKIG